MLIDPQVKPDVDEACERLIAWWRHEDIGRPALLVRAPRYGLLEAQERIPVPDSLIGQWTDPAYRVALAQTIARGTFWGAEMIPFQTVWTGAMSLASALGATPRLMDTESVWWEPCIDSWEDALPLRYDVDADWWQRTQTLARTLTREANAAYVPALPDIGSPGDIVAALRGTARTCSDLLDNPDTIRAALDQVLGIWASIIDEVYDWVDCERNGSVPGWTGIWHPRRAYVTQNDISALISPRDFRDFFLPGIVAQAGKVEGTIFHLDGPEALGTVDALLDVPEIQVIEWSTDVKDLDLSRWMDFYRQVLAAGKNLLLEPRIDEVEFLCRNLPRVGLMLYVSGASFEQAQRLISSAYEWSRA